MNLNDYYFVKCFAKKEYRDSFNGGTLYFRSLAYYWALENTFQQDYEGEIFRQMGTGYLIAADSEFENVLKRSNTTADVLMNMGIHGKVLGETKDVSLQINGYISCFYLLPKTDIRIGNGELSFTDPKTEHDLRFFFHKYLDEKGNTVFAGIYDAARLCRIIDSHFENKNYSLAYGVVDYKDLSPIERINAYRQNEIDRIVFTKPLSYRYQREFRLFVSPKDTPVNEELKEPDVIVSPSIIGTFEYVENQADTADTQ